jgi:hypothetical protein
MAPRTKPEVPTFRASLKEQAELRRALEQLDRGEYVELTEEELGRMAETGEWPERLD